MLSILHVVSMSGGKDSTATAILAFETQPRESIRLVFADTGNEHEATYAYLDYLEAKFEKPIVRLRADFSGEIERKRRYMIEKWPAKGVPAATIDRALTAFHPTGNPFLDLCMLKGRFPSRRAQFCTQRLKTEPLLEYQMGLIDAGEAEAIWSWQGVRIEESLARRHRLACPVNIAFSRFFEEIGGGIYTYRPILRWSAEDAFEAHRLAGIEPNPLYLQGMNRVGCMPCINASKSEIAEIASRFPEHMDRIEEWEAIVAQVSRRGAGTFFPAPDREKHLDKRGIRQVIEWSRTDRGGRQRPLEFDEPAACSSAYGLCE